MSSHAFFFYTLILSQTFFIIRFLPEKYQTIYLNFFIYVSLVLVQLFTIHNHPYFACLYVRKIIDKITIGWFAYLIFLHHFRCSRRVHTDNFLLLSQRRHNVLTTILLLTWFRGRRTGPRGRFSKTCEITDARYYKTTVVPWRDSASRVCLGLGNESERGVRQRSENGKEVEREEHRKEMIKMSKLARVLNGTVYSVLA